MIRTLFEYGPLLVWVALVILFVRPLRLGRAWSVTLSLLLLVASQKFLMYKVFGGDSFVPDLPERFINVTGWAYSTCMLLFGLTCAYWTLRGCISLAWRLARRGEPERRTPAAGLSVTRRDLLLMPFAAAATAGWGVWEGVRTPQTRTRRVYVKWLPEAFDGFRVVQLSDLHCSPAARRGRIEGIVDIVNSLDADLVCITGDFVDGSPEERFDDLEPLKRLRARHGVLGCAGNHEYYYDYARWRPVFESLGVRMLDNAHCVIERGGGRLVVGGVTDIVATMGYFGVMEGPNVAKAFARAPAEGCRMLLQHRPINVAANRRCGVALQLSGHTHGGAVLGMDRIVKSVNDGHVRGIYREGDLTLHVSPGTGQWAGFPLRVGVPSEISQLVLACHENGGLV